MIHPLLTQVFEQFDRAAIAWCLLRGEQELSTPSGDVDILIGRADAGRVRRILERSGFVRLRAWGRGSHTFFLAYYPYGEQWLKLDIVTELAYGTHFALRTGAEAACLARRQRTAGLAVLADDDAFWALLLHCLLDKGYFAPHRAARLQELVETAHGDGPLARVFDTVSPPGWSAARAIEHVARGDLSSLLALIPSLSATWERRQRPGARRRRVVNRSLLRSEKLLHLAGRHGLSVALLGPDGTGKSTLAAAIQQTFYFPARTIYMGTFKRPPSRSRVPGADLSRRLLGTWWPYSIALCHRALGRLVIFDRYIYDALQEQGGHRRERLYLWMLGHALPRPDMILILDAPGRVMYERKGEHTPEELEANRQRLLALRHRFPNVEIIDANRSAEVVCQDVITRIWRQYSARWHKA